jgi:hypothetical protein
MNCNVAISVLHLIVIYFLHDTGRIVSTLQTYVVAFSIRVCGMYSNHFALRDSIVQDNVFLILRTCLFGKTEKWLNWNKISLRVMSWNQLAQFGSSDGVWDGICELCSVCTGIVSWSTEYQICPWEYLSEYIYDVVSWYFPNAITVITWAVGWLV